MLSWSNNILLCPCGQVCQRGGGQCAWEGGAASGSRAHKRSAHKRSVFFFSFAFIGSNADQQISGLPAKLKPVSLAACGNGICAALAGGDTIHFWGRSLKDKDTDYADGSIRFPAVQLVATSHSRTIAARNAAGDWKFFGHLETTDLRLAAKNAKGALQVTFSEEHILALLPADGRR